MIRRIKLGNQPLNLDTIFRSGQVFLWSKYGEWWYGSIKDKPVALKKERDVIVYKSIERMDEEISEFLRLNDDYLTKYNELSNRDGLLRALIRKFYGLRIVKQDIWPCIAAYVISPGLSVRAIEGILEKASFVTHKLGAKTYLLPSPQDLPSRLTVSYRKRESIKQMAELMKKGFFEKLLDRDYLQAFRELIQIKGIGGKVADCISLFCLDKEEAFPIDRWVSRALSKNYPWMVSEENLTLKHYMAISATARGYFGKCAGLAQQFLYMAMREGLLTF